MFNLQNGGKAVLCGLSNPLRRTEENEKMLGDLKNALGKRGWEASLCPGIFSDERERWKAGGDAADRRRALAFMNACLDETVTAVFDISGGDEANGVLEYLDYEALAARHRKAPLAVCGYSDLTAVLNAVYARAGIPAYLYQVRNLLSSQAPPDSEVFKFSSTMVRGERMEGVMTGGNIRCFLKLAGTPYMPKLRGKLLFLESNGGDYHKTVTAFSQLRQIGGFGQASGLLLGTFTALDKKMGRECVRDLALSMTGNLPVAMTEEIGHGENSRCLVIGGRYDKEFCV